jgi:Fe2+ transport system protein B
VNAFTKVIVDGILRGLKTALMLLRVMIPVYLCVTVLKHTAFFGVLAGAAGPAMRIFGLPGDAVVPVVTGIFTDEYGIVAAMSGFAFDKAAITTIAMITLCFHSIPVETLVTRQIGMPAWKMTVYRLALAIATGVFTGWLAGWCF